MKLYTLDCPKCLVLERKLGAKNIEYETVKDIEVMKKLGIDTVPVLELNDGSLLKFSEAVKWINSYTEEK